MKRFALTALIAVFAAAPALAQPAPPQGLPGAPPPEMQQHMQAAHDAARTQAMTALSNDHQTKVNAIIARVKSGQLTDARDAAKAIDAVLTPKEAQSVLAARDKMLVDMHGDGDGAGLHPGGAGQGADGPPPGGDPGPDGGPTRGGDPPPGAVGPPGSGPQPGGAGSGAPGMAGGEPPHEGGRHHRGGHAMRNDPGFALLMLSLDHDQMRALFADARLPR